MQSLKPSWHRAWTAVGARGSGISLFEQLIERYSEGHRRYHTLQHLNECIQQFEATAPLAMRAGEVEIALWFHDAIYELRSSENELQSANWASKELLAAGVSTECAEAVHAMVLVTRHAVMPATQDQQLLVDIDLSILGAPPERFAEYEAQVRQEYSWVPGILFRSKRKTILADFLARKTIYSTNHFQAQLETQARENLQRSIEQLSS